MEKTNRIVSLDLHDFSVLRSRFDLLLTLKEFFPKMKLSLFTIPYDYEYELTELKIMRSDSLQKIEANKDWLEFIPHGLTHFLKEFEKADRQIAIDYFDNVIDEMEKTGLPRDRIVKGFCPPNWLWNQQVVDVMDEKGWWGAVDRNQPGMIRPEKFYVYTHSIHEPFWFSNQKVIKLHGHMSPPNPNDLESCLMKILKLPTDSEWKFASELVEEAK